MSKNTGDTYMKIIFKTGLQLLEEKKMEINFRTGLEIMGENKPRDLSKLIPLTKKQQIIWNLNYHENLMMTEIARRLSQSTSNIGAHLKRVYKKGYPVKKFWYHHSERQWRVESLEGVEYPFGEPGGIVNFNDGTIDEIEIDNDDYSR